ncbi:MAG: MarR family winged helix-turn-helix transcriptional regulator [Actinomycetota bacterium]
MPSPSSTANPPAAACRPAALAADLRVALMRSVRRLRQEKSSESITDGQYSVLAWLEKHGPMTPRELADHEHVQPPSMTRTVNALVDAGLVTRADHPEDGRQVLVAVTEAGAREVRETRKRRDAWLAKRLAELTPEEREVLARAAEILRRVVAR